MRFEWDGVKAALNLVKHGLSFDEAGAVFDDPLAVYQEDVAHSAVEYRLLVIGRIAGGMVTVAFTLRGNKTRLISARYASRQERRRYESAKRRRHRLQ